jgi:hypothetical protein
LQRSRPTFGAAVQQVERFGVEVATILRFEEVRDFAFGELEVARPQLSELTLGAKASDRDFRRSSA